MTIAVGLQHTDAKFLKKGGALPLSACGLSARAVNALAAAGYRSVGQCLTFNERELLKIRNIGRTTTGEILALLNKFRNGSKTPSDDQEASSKKLELMEAEEINSLTVLLSVPIDALGFSVRAGNVFKKLKLQCLYDLVRKTPQQLLEQRNCGRKTLTEIVLVLRELGLVLGTEYNFAVVDGVEQYRALKQGNLALILEDLKHRTPEVAEKLNNSKKKSISDSKAEFCKRCFEEYTRGGSLAKAGKVFGLTRERIRQVLVKGSKLGLFDYKPREYILIQKEKLLNDYGKYLSLGSVATLNNISSSYLRKLCTAYEITPKVIRQTALKTRKDKCVEEYNQVRIQLAHHPTTTELQRQRKWRSLEARISRLWGSFDAFREQLNIPKPPQGNPAFQEHTRKWREHQKRLSLIVKMERLDDIRDSLSRSGLLRSSQISEKCDLKSQTALKLLGLLIATGEVRREGDGSATNYRLVHRGEKE